MKRAAVVAVLVSLLATPGVAQHGGARGGSSGHAAGGGHAASGGFAAHGSFGGFAGRSGGFSARPGSGSRGFAPRGYAPRGFNGPGRTGFAPRSGASANRMPYRSSGYSPDRFHGGDHHRRPYYRGFNGFNGYPYAFAYPWWPGYPIDLDPWLFAPDDYDSGDQSAENGNGGYAPAPYQDYGEPGSEGYSGDSAPYANGYAAQQPYPGPAAGYERQFSAPQAVSPRPSYTGGSAPTPQQDVTLIFKDGRQPEKIHNYMLTADTLTVLDGQYQQIPIDQIDMAATEQANRAAGISFRAPGSSN